MDYFKRYMKGFKQRMAQTNESVEFRLFIASMLFAIIGFVCLVASLR